MNYICYQFYFIKLILFLKCCYYRLLNNSSYLILLINTNFYLDILYKNYHYFMFYHFLYHFTQNIATSSNSFYLSNLFNLLLKKYSLILIGNCNCFYLLLFIQKCYIQIIVMINVRISLYIYYYFKHCQHILLYHLILFF